MKNENKKRILAGVIAVQLVLQASAMSMTVFADETATEAVTASTDAVSTDAAAVTTEESTSTPVAAPVTQTAADAITLNNQTQIPAELKQGKLVNIRGVVTSAESDITAVTIGIYDESGQRVTGSAAQPKAKTYDLSRLDDFVTFDKLTPGKYTYRVTVSNAANSNFVVQETAFTVVSGDTPGQTTPSANDVLTISGAVTVPDTLKQGSTLNVKGTVTSASSTITYLTCGVYDSEGKFVTGRTIAPKVNSYDLQRLDAYVAFDKLPAGSYIFAVIATNASNNNYALVNKSFKVEAGDTPSAPGTSSTEDKLTGSGITTVPDNLKLGAVLSIRGTVTSASSNMTALTAGVYDDAGKFVTGKTIAPNAKSYDLKNVDAYIAFNKLPAGSYTFAVIASNAANTNYAVVSKKFTVGNASTTPGTTPGATEDKLTITGGTTVPDNLASGKALNVTGTVTSASTDMTALTVGVYNIDGKFMTGKTINPKAKTYDLKNLDRYVEFNKLPAGEYVYAVIASNGGNTNYALANKKFTVGSGSTPNTPGTSADKLTIAGGMNVPSNLAVGKALNVVGTVTSETSNMTALTVGVYDSKGNFKTGKTINPNAKTYDLKNLDRYVEFNKLAAGSYVYAVIASNAANTNMTLVNKSFTVGSGTSVDQPSTTGDALTISGGTNVPDTLAVGKALGIRGTVTSANSNMTALTCGVYDAGGKFITGKTINPNAKSYDLKKLDAYVVFNSLPAGTYTYAVIASNAGNTNYALVSKKFTVGSGGGTAAPTNDSITISGGTTVPSTVNKGKGVIVRGTVTSANSNFTSVTVGVYDASGKLVTGKTANPNAKTYNVGALDSAVRFDQLAAGTYTYRVIASNAGNNSFTVVNQTFTVK